MKLQRIDKTLFKKTTLTNVGGLFYFFMGSHWETGFLPIEWIVCYVLTQI